MKVTVRQTKVRGETQWCVNIFRPSGRQRRFFATKKEADDIAAQERKALAGLIVSWDVLTMDERRELIELRQGALNLGTTLREVFEAWRLMPAKSKFDDLKLNVAIARCVQEKVRSGRRTVYTDALESALCHFARGRETMPLSKVTPQMIRDFADAHSKTKHTLATWSNRLSALFSWAVRNGHVGSNPVDRIEKITPEAKPVDILSVRQTAIALVWTRRKHHRYLAWLALSMMAGLRPEEADKVTWTDVNLAEATVVLDATKTKTRTRRVVHLTPAALSWLAVAKSTGADLPVPQVSRRRYIRGLRDRLKLRAWPVKLLRKTCASYLMAAWQDAGRVADELGHSPGILLRTYRALVSQKDAERWLRLVAEERKTKVSFLSPSILRNDSIPIRAPVGILP